MMPSSEYRPSSCHRYGNYAQYIYLWARVKRHDLFTYIYGGYVSWVENSLSHSKIDLFKVFLIHAALVFVD